MQQQKFIDKSAKYTLQGFIALDPIYKDYYVYLKNKKREQQ